MKTTKSNNGTYEISGLSAEQLAVIKSILDECKCGVEDMEDVFEENEVNVILNDEEVEILNGIEIEF